MASKNISLEICISDHLKFICNSTVFARKVNCATSISQIRKLTLHKFVSGEPEMEASDLAQFLRNIGSKHLGVMNSQTKTIETVRNPKMAKILGCKQDSYPFLKNRDVMVMGGCFNGIHKGHRNAIRTLSMYMKQKYKKPALAIFLERDAVIVKKNRERGNVIPIIVQPQAQRAAALRMIPNIDYIVLIEEGFDRKYFELMEKLNVREMAVEDKETLSLKYCLQHQEKFLSIHGKVVEIKIFGSEAPVSSYHFFKNDLQK